MALIVPLTIPATNKYEGDVLVDVPEVSYPKAYARLYTIRTFAQETYMLVCWYADEASRFSGADPVRAQEFMALTADLKGDIYPAAYAHLKTLPEFEGAVDHPVADPADVPAVNSPPAQA